MTTFDQILQEVDKRCREESIPMLGPEKAEFLVTLVEKTKPSLIVECGTAIGYSGLWMLEKLKAAGNGRLITVEIEPDRAREAQGHFDRAGFGDLVDSRIGNAIDVLQTITDPVDFLLLDNNFSNYFPCFQAIEPRLVEGTTVVADNVGIGADSMADYLEHVRSRYDCQTCWFDTELPWVKRDAMEVTIYRKESA